MSKFDISEYEFTDSRLEHDGDNLIAEYEQFQGHPFGYTTEQMYLELSKQDAIAIAKHFNLTAEDLK